METENTTFPARDKQKVRQCLLLKIKKPVIRIVTGFILNMLF